MALFCTYNLLYMCIAKSNTWQFKYFFHGGKKGTLWYEAGFSCNYVNIRLTMIDCCLTYEVRHSLATVLNLYPSG